MLTTNKKGSLKYNYVKDTRTEKPRCFYQISGATCLCDTSLLCYDEHDVNTLQIKMKSKTDIMSTVTSDSNTNVFSFN